MREPPVLHPVDPTHVRVDGRCLVSFAGCDYLRLSWHPDVRAALARGARELGATAAASRCTTGNLPVYGRLERDLARFFQTAAAALTSAGYTAPIVAAQALAPDHSHLLIDERAHACLLDAAAVSALPLHTFRHADPDHLRRLRAGLGRASRALVLTDGLFSHSAQAAPLRAYLDTLRPRDTLLVDDAHGVGVLGQRGRGTLEYLGITDPRVVLTATLSKAFGAYGGVVLGSVAVREAIFTRSRLFLGNTQVPPACAVAALAALQVLRQEGADRRRRLASSLDRIHAAFRPQHPLRLRPPGPMLCVAPQSPTAARRIRRRLLDAGIFPPLIRYPNGPAATYFRFAISSEHTAEQVADLELILAESRNDVA